MTRCRAGVMGRIWHSEFDEALSLLTRFGLFVGFCRELLPFPGELNERCLRLALALSGLKPGLPRLLSVALRPLKRWQPGWLWQWKESPLIRPERRKGKSVPGVFQHPDRVAASGSRREPLASPGQGGKCWAQGQARPSVVNLKFLISAWHPRLGTSNSKTTLESIDC